MSKSIKSNYIYTLINVISGMIFPLITFPYASRILEADGIGTVSFLNTIIGYIVLLTSLGIPTYGIRAISQVRDNYHETNKTALEILILHVLLTFIGYILIFLICFTVSQVKENITLFLLLSTSIILTTIGCPWFFNGVEDFKFITIRSLLVRTGSIVLLFIFVKEKGDLIYYAAYTVLATVGNNVINLFRLRNKYIKQAPVSFKDLEIKRHIRPAFQIFMFNIITSIYLKLDILMLGLMKDVNSVGYFTAASNLVHIFVSLINALGQATLPRLSNLYATKQNEKFATLSQKAYRFIQMICFPIAFGIFALAPTLIFIFCGNSFAQAVTTTRILSFVVIAIGMSNLFGMQILYPMGRMKIVNISVTIGASINLFLNIFLIHFFSQDGAAIATIIAESSVMATQIIMSRKYLPFHIINRWSLNYIISTLIMFSVCQLLCQLEMLQFLKLILIPIVGAIVYITVLLILKDTLVLELYSNYIKKLRK